MSSFISYFFGWSEYFYGPARYAPYNNIKKIKDVIPTDMFGLNQEIVQDQLNSLKKTAKRI